MYNGVSCMYNADMATLRMNFRLAPDEKAAVERAADELGMTQSEFLKAAAAHCIACAAFAEQFNRPRISGRRGLRGLFRSD